MTIIKTPQPRQVTHTEANLLENGFKRVGNEVVRHFPDTDDSNFQLDREAQNAIELIISCGFLWEAFPNPDGGTNLFVKKMAA